jgi:hypothetical protein
LAIAGASVIVLGIVLFELGAVSSPVCPQPPICYGGGVSHPFYFVAVTLVLIGIAIVIIGFLMAVKLKNSNLKKSGSA